MHYASLRLRSSASLLALAIFGAASFGCTVGNEVSSRDGSLGGTDGSTADAGSVRDGGPRRDGGQEDTGTCGIESCDNGLDDNCDGRIDENCTCLPGQTQACFRGTAAARGVGGCHDGTQTCVDGLEFSSWGDCEGDLLPTDEVCDTGGIDEDCNGAANEGCECDPAAGPVPCGTDEGACVPGTQTCVDGHLGACEGLLGPGTESCNALDDDCDGTTDEGIRRACGSDVGECASGTETCVAGAFEACAGGASAGVEDCDGLDDDCDGAIDEDLMRACGSATGACTAGTQSCAAGAWSTCGGETLPMLETCNAVDDDCDGSTDESITRSCGSSVGVCRPGLETCAAGTFGACIGGTTPGTELCDGSRDENCNGTVDEGCTCVSGATRPCGTDVGACVRGMQTCTTDWGTCTGAIDPVSESCNRADDDCDGSIDEAGICPTSAPTAICPAPVTGNVLSNVTLSGSGSDPDGGTVTYSWTVTSRPVGSTANPAMPSAASTSFFLDASGVYTLRFCVRDDEGVSTCCDVTVTSRAPGALHVEVSWSTAYGDVDSHLLSTTRVPDVGWFTVDDCYWANRTPDWGAAGAAANPTLDRDDTDGFGPENTTILTSPLSGRYTVGVHYYCQHSIGSGAAPGDGPTTATVRVYCGGALIATYPSVSLSETDDFRVVASVDYPSCTGMSIDRLTNGSSILPDAFTAARHCEVSCARDSDCPTGDRCASVGGGGPPRMACVLR